MESRVKEIYIAPEAGAPMQKVGLVHATAYTGLTGDRYAKGVGFWDDKREAVRDVTLIAENDIAGANREFGTDFTASETRRNLIIEGPINLQELVGKDFYVGGVCMHGIEDCAPCNRPPQLIGKKANFANAFKGGRGGIRAEILSSGVVAEGDVVTIVKSVET